PAVDLDPFLNMQLAVQAPVLFLCDPVPVPFVCPLQLVAAQVWGGGQVHAIQRQRHQMLLKPASSRMPSRFVLSASLRTETSAERPRADSSRMTVAGTAAAGAGCTAFTSSMRFCCSVWLRLAV